MSRLRRAIRIAGAAVLTFIALWFSALVSGQSMTACDREVGHPSDPERVGPGVSSSQVDTERAMAACTADLRADPDNPRLQYQLARAIVYHADRHGTSYEEGMVYLAQSADAGHVQAMFVYGLMLSREARACEAAPWTRRAAEGGLKAARLAYVDSAVGGQWADCDVTFNKDVMSDFLDAAADQVSGYYEKMLLGALRREVAALEPVAP
jgi:TPR repeat protein